MFFFDDGADRSVRALWTKLDRAGVPSLAGRTLDESLAIAAQWRTRLGQRSTDSAHEQREDRGR